MAVLKSDLFSGVPELENCALRPDKHIQFIKGHPPLKGGHIGRIHEALDRLGFGGSIAQNEKDKQAYGETTAKAVGDYKKSRTIVNTAYQTAPDDIVGQMTIKRMDAELFGRPTSTREDAVTQAFNDSRASLRVALRHLKSLKSDIDALASSEDPSSTPAMFALMTKHSRNIAVLCKRLKLVANPLDPIFRATLDKVITLVEKNLARARTLLAAGTSGLCDPTNPRNAGGLPHAWTLASQADPKTHLCEPFFTSDSRDLQRDVVTHEYFHLFGLEDISVATTDQALRNANTLAQVVPSCRIDSGKPIPTATNVRSRPSRRRDRGRYTFTSPCSSPSQ